MKTLIRILCPIVIISMLSCNSKKENVRIFIAWPGATFLPSYEWKIGEEKPTGVEPKLIERILDIAGYEYSYVPNYNHQKDGDVRIDAIIDSVADISIRSITITPEREKLVDFSIPYYYDGVSALVMDESDIKTKEDLKGAKVFAVDFTTAHIWAKENFPDSDIYDYSKFTSNFAPEKYLRFGKIDAYLMDRSGLLVLAKTSSKFRLLDGKFTKEPYGIAVRKGNKKLLADINSAILKLQESGELERIISGFEN